MYKCLLLLLTGPLVISLHAEVKLPALFGDHMVMQQGVPLHVWGWAQPDEAVNVEFRGQKVSTTTNQDGGWEAWLNPSDAGGPYKIMLQGSNNITLEDIYVGEVWVASGQSNMVWPLGRSRDAEKEIAAANHPQIRYFKVTLATADKPKDDVEGQWLVVSPETAGDFSGVGYFFARHLQAEMKVPFGIIQSAWGGTPAEAWTSAETLASDPALAEFVTATSDRPQHNPRVLFNAMIAPLTPYPIQGAIWYQGENNAGKGQGMIYRRLFQSMILDWRRAWDIGAFPFLFVQLANYGKVSESSTWPELRESQTAALELDKTGMAVTIDIGNSTDIHPINKQDVGLRLALAAQAVAYGNDEVVYSGPLYRQTTREGSMLQLWFDHLGSGLDTRDGDLEGFEIAGQDGMFVPAKARIDGENVLLSSPTVPVPVQARYAWHADPSGNLFNKSGLPASPFRTMQ